MYSLESPRGGDLISTHNIHFLIKSENVTLKYPQIFTFLCYQEKLLEVQNTHGNLVRVSRWSNLAHAWLSENHTLLREATVKIAFVPFWKGVYTIRKEFAPSGSKFFPNRVDRFSEGAWCAEKANRKSQNLSPLAKRAQHPQSVPSPFKLL